MTRAALVALALIAAILAVYSDTFGYGFVALDVPRYVTGNEIVKAGLTVDGLRWAFTSSHDGNWFPLTWLSHMLDVELYGLSGGGHHATNVLLHALNSVLLLALFLRMTGAFWASAFVAALFALHPLRVESVAWIAERKDVLSSTFGLLSLGCYARYGRGDGAGWLRGSTASLLLGLLCKPMLVTLPFVMLLLDRWPLERWRSPGWLPPRELVREKLPAFVLVALSCGITLAAQSGAGALETAQHVALPERIANAGLALVGYLRLAFWPTGLSAFHPHPWIPSEGGTLPSGGGVAACFALLLLVTIGVLRQPQRPYLAVGWLWFVGMLVPVLGLVQVGGQGLAERYTYLPLVGISVMLAWGVRDLLERSGSGALRRATAAAAALALGALALSAHARVQSWRDSQTLYRDALAVAPGNHFMRFALALERRRAGATAEALEHYRTILAAQPESARAWNGLGMTQLSAGEFEDAASSFRRAIALAPGVPLTHFNLGNALWELGLRDEALAAYEQALTLRPDSERIRRVLSERRAAATQDPR